MPKLFDFISAKERHHDLFHLPRELKEIVSARNFKTITIFFCISFLYGIISIITLSIFYRHNIDVKIYSIYYFFFFLVFSALG
ncbi:MAG: hypothetical protein K5866_05885, partial [Treponema sp.]|nr:hypothetical protein [Treponema sp.]